MSEEVEKSIQHEEVKSLQELTEKILHFYLEREWTQFHAPKNIAMNLAVETGELLEHFRWLTEEQSHVKTPKALEEIRKEIADVFINILYLARLLGIDPVQAVHDKLEETALKYPVEKCKGLCLKYTEYE